MSKRNASTAAHAVANIVFVTSKMTEDEIENTYGVIFVVGGVLDPIYNQTFASISDWATFSYAQDEEGADDRPSRGGETE